MQEQKLDAPPSYSARHILKTGFDQFVTRLEYMQGRLDTLESENLKLNEMLNDEDRRKILSGSLPPSG